MKQRVKHVNFLAKSTLDLASAGLKGDIFALPKNAEIIKFDVEVVEPSDAGVTLDIGLDESADFIANDLNLSAKANHASSVVTATKKDGVINWTLNNKATKGQVVFRIHYFLPSEIVAEY